MEKLIFGDYFSKQKNICTQSEFTDFSYENLEQVKSKQNRLVSPKDSAGLSLDLLRKFREVRKTITLIDRIVKLFYPNCAFNLCKGEIHCSFFFFSWQTLKHMTTLMVWLAIIIKQRRIYYYPIETNRHFLKSQYILEYYEKHE